MPCFSIAIAGLQPGPRVISRFQPEFWFPVSGSRFRFGPASLASEFLVAGYQLCFRAIGRLQSGFRFLISGFRFRFRPAALASQFSPSGSQPDSRAIAWFQPRFWCPISGFRFWFGRAPLVSQFPISSSQWGSRAMALLQPGFHVPVSGVRFWAGLYSACLSICGFQFSAGGALVRLSGVRSDSGFWLQILVWPCSARFSICCFQFPWGSRAIFWSHAPDSGLDLIRSLLSFWFLSPGFWPGHIC